MRSGFFISWIVAAGFLFSFASSRAWAVSDAECASLFARLSLKENNKNELSVLTEQVNHLALVDPTASEASYLHVLLDRTRHSPSNIVMNEVRQAIRALNTKEQIRKYIATAMLYSKKTMMKGLRQWKYIAVAQAMQIGAEAYSRRDDISDANPLTMFKKLFSDKDFDQDFAFMTNETFWMSALSTGTGEMRSMSEVKKSFRLCAMLGFVDSNAMSLAIKGEADKGRVALDTGWEMIIGNAQTQLDLTSLKAFEQLALKVGSSRLKLLGYVVVIADQTLGYYGYSEAVKRYEASKKEAEQHTAVPDELKMVPVFKQEK